MPKIVSVKEELGHHDEGNDLYVMDIQPGEVEGLAFASHATQAERPIQAGIEKGFGRVAGMAWIAAKHGGDAFELEDGSPFSPR